MAWFAADNAWLSRLVVQRGTALVYLIAFAAARNQFPALLGERGLMPATRFVRAVPFKRSPSLFHLGYSDRRLAAVAWGGMVISAAAVMGVLDHVPAAAAIVAWLIMWVLYLSIVNVGQTFYGFGWESLLLEAGFLVAFLGNDRVAPPVLIIWLARWLVFRLEFGAGLIKLRGDRCWRDLTCLYYHHETQPMPNPLTWFFHHLPKPLHRVEVAANHFTQLVVPFALFAPQPVADVAGVCIVVTQGWLMLSGNFSWLNAITMVVAFSAFDDRFLHHLLPVGHPALGSAGTPGSPGWFEVVVLVIAC